MLPFDPTGLTLQEKKLCNPQFAKGEHSVECVYNFLGKKTFFFAVTYWYLILFPFLSFQVLKVRILNVKCS